MATRRKPPGMTYPDWIELQIRDAQRLGTFDNLPGAGQPIPDIDTPRSETDWLVSYLHKENVDVSIMLPPSLALAKEVEDLPQRLSSERSEDKVREIIEDLNARIRAARLAPGDGPPMRTRPVDLEATLLQWRGAQSSKIAARNALSAVPAPPPSVSPASPTRQRRTWWRRPK